MHELEQLVVGVGGLQLVDALEQAEVAREAYGQLDADRGERVRGTEVVGREGLVPDEGHALAHVWTLPGAVLGHAPTPARETS